MTITLSQVQQGAAALGMTELQIDELFTAAATL